MLGLSLIAVIVCMMLWGWFWAKLISGAPLDVVGTSSLPLSEKVLASVLASCSLLIWCWIALYNTGLLAFPIKPGIWLLTMALAVMDGLFLSVPLLPALLLSGLFLIHPVIDTKTLIFLLGAGVTWVGWGGFTKKFPLQPIDGMLLLSMASWLIFEEVPVFLLLTGSLLMIVAGFQRKYPVPFIPACTFSFWLTIVLRSF